VRRITLTRKAARIKLTAAKKATYFLQVCGGTRHTREVPVADMVRAFERDDRARLRIMLEDSQHVITIEDNSEIRSGYEVSF
jgi:hypothetical protein